MRSEISKAAASHCGIDMSHTYIKYTSNDNLFAIPDIKYQETTFEGFPVDIV